MKTLKSILLVTALTIPLFGFADEFYKVGKCYLFIPRIDMVAKGQVVQVTNQEIVFKLMGRIWPTNSTNNSKEFKRIQEKTNITQNYLISHDRTSLEYPSTLTGFNVSYSRSALTGIELDRCGK